VCADLSGEHNHLGFILHGKDLPAWEEKDPANPRQTA